MFSCILCDIILMKRIAKILMERDGLSAEDADKQVKDFFADMVDDWKSGGDLFDWEGEFTSEFGLEPDFFEDLVFAMC